MKKIQVVFAAMALLLASAAVFANTFTTTITDFKHTNNAANCSATQVSTTGCSVTGSHQCIKVEGSGEGATTYYYSRRTVVDVPPSDTCQKLLGYSGNTNDLP